MKEYLFRVLVSSSEDEGEDEEDFVEIHANNICAARKKFQERAAERYAAVEWCLFAVYRLI